MDVVFDATSSEDPNGTIESYEWDFDDGSSATGIQASHTYTSAGEYTPELTITDDDGKTDSYSNLTISVTSTNEPPNASFTADPNSGTAPVEVTFDASASNDPDGSIESYSWDFGDGSSGTGEAVTHTSYSSAGSYTAQLTVEDDAGNEDSETETLSVFTDVTYDTITDPRDGQTYKIVDIGKQTWFAENINYKTESTSLCYNKDPSNCDKYGRMYTFESAKNACPSGWHLPTYIEWCRLLRYVDSSVSKCGGGGRNVNLGTDAGTKLKSTSGWDDGGNGTDAYGFNALPAGIHIKGGSSQNKGKSGGWYSNCCAYRAVSYGVTSRSSYAIQVRAEPDLAVSVRCIKND